jgi:hypothetical protein
LSPQIGVFSAVVGEPFTYLLLGSALNLVVERTAGIGVRRDKAALSSGWEAHRRFAPAGSNWSSHGGNEMAEAFD